MARHFPILLAFGFTISGCASTPPPSCGPIGWERLNYSPYKPSYRQSYLTEESRPKLDQRAERDPPKPDSNAEREKALAGLRPNSAAWWAMREQMDAEDQRRLRAKLVICRGCLPAVDDPTDRTGSTEPSMGVAR
jgi:hypothetical protein